MCSVVTMTRADGIFRVQYAFFDVSLARPSNPCRVKKKYRCVANESSCERVCTRKRCETNSMDTYIVSVFHTQSRLHNLIFHSDNVCVYMETAALYRIHILSTGPLAISVVVENRGRIGRMYFVQLRLSKFFPVFTFSVSTDCLTIRERARDRAPLSISSHIYRRHQKLNDFFAYLAAVHPPCFIIPHGRALSSL